MGTHPIFESDFDCLTETLTANYSEREHACPSYDRPCSRALQRCSHHSVAPESAPSCGDATAQLAPNQPVHFHHLLRSHLLLHPMGILSSTERPTGPNYLFSQTH